MTALTPQYMRVLADDVQHTVDNGYEFAPENVIAALRTAADEVDRLRAVIENAPHEQQCAYRLPVTMRIPEDMCTCWKAGVR